ncbi:MAG: PilW family protein [Pseudomonadales bacterium]
MKRFDMKKPGDNFSLGFSLVELMIAMALSVVLLLGVVSIYTNSKQTYNVQEGASRLQENIRFAMGRLTREVGAAGYMGCLEPNRQIGGEDVIINTLAVKTGLSNFTTPLSGLDGSGANNSDEITVNRASAATQVRMIEQVDRDNDPKQIITFDSSDPDYARIQKDQTLILADCSRAVAFMVTNTPIAGDSGQIEHDTGITNADGQSNATVDLGWSFGGEKNALGTLMRVVGNTYSIGDSARGACAVATPGFCALLENGQELVEGVQSMQILYGVDTDVPADSEVDTYVDSTGVLAAAAAGWNAVTSVRITLVVNEVERIQGSNNGLTNGRPKTFVNTIRLRSRGI